MTLYGFQDKRVATTLLRIGKQGIHTSTHADIPSTRDNGSRIFVVRTNSGIPATMEGTTGPVPGSGTVTVCQLGESEVEPRLEGNVTRTAYNLATDPLPEDTHYIAVEDSFGKLWILSCPSSAPAPTHIVTASGTVFGMGGDQASGLAIYATDLSVSSDTVHVYRTVAVEMDVEQTGGNEQ